MSNDPVGEIMRKEIKRLRMDVDELKSKKPPRGIHTDAHADERTFSVSIIVDGERFADIRVRREDDEDAWNWTCKFAPGVSYGDGGGRCASMGSAIAEALRHSR